MKKISFLVIIFTVFMTLSSAGFAQSDTSFYNTAKDAVATGDKDYAFMCFRSLLKLTHESRYHKEALFATGEYYYSIGDYRSADKAFSSFIDAYPKDEALPYSIVYLLKLSKQMQISKTIEDLRKQVITFKQLSLLFSEFKELSFISPLNLHYKAIYFIDRIEIYINEALFEKIYF
ncbi:MAG: outer membrane protein assembly factor BamD [Candidatus Omnitrophica bacterium]|nr:outer membrane protein assembly factor BamD [Candidatus Omnitrophota bacterium]